MTPATTDALILLLPPPEFVPFMLEVLRRKSIRGDNVPDSWACWLIRVRDIRAGNLVSAADCLTDEEWRELAELEF